MNMPIRIHQEDRAFSQDEIGRIANMSRLDELLLSLFEQRHDRELIITAFSMSEDGQAPRNLIINVNKGYGPKLLLSIEIDGQFLQATHKFKALNEEMIKLADQDKVWINEQWFDERDERLRIKEDPWEGERVAAPTALTELVLSYAFSSHGMVIIRPDLAELKSGVREVIRLELRFLGTDLSKEEGWAEELVIIVDKLKSLLLKRDQRGLGQTSPG